MSNDIFWAAISAAMPTLADLGTFAALTLSFAAPLAFFLSWYDKKKEEERNSQLIGFDGWQDLLAEVGLDNDGDNPVQKTWRQVAHDSVDAAFDQAEASIDSSKKVFYASVDAAKGVATLTALPFVLLAEDISDMAKWAQAHTMAISATALTVALAVAFPDLAIGLGIAGLSATTLGYVAVEVKALVEAKVEALIDAKVQAKVEAAIAKREALIETEAIVETETETEAPTQVKEIAEYAVQLVLSADNFDLTLPKGRKDARAYLRDNDVEISNSTNRYQIKAAFQQLN